MNFNKKVFIIIITIWLSTLITHAQDSIQQIETPPTVIVKVRAKKDKILLRWGVNNKYAWKYGNQYGYTIVRTTIVRDGNILTNPEKIKLAEIKAKPLIAWENLAKKNDMAAVVAQAIYGEDFEMNDQENNQVLKVIYQSEELDRRFGFAMFAIDQDFDVAKIAGLGYVDTQVKPTEKYLYTITSNVPKEMLEIKESGVYISPSEEESLPAPSGFIGYFHKESFILAWDYDLLLNYYTSYNLEKSEDGIHFKKINKRPITKLADNKSSSIMQVDSVTQYNKKYWYRVVGISLFNELGQPSKSVEVMAYQSIKSVPFFKDNHILSENEVQLEWTYPIEEEPLVKQFNLLLADNALGPYKTVKEGIAASSRTYTHKGLMPSNYFKLNVIPKQGDSIMSSPNFVQPVDSIPPIKPVGLTGTIDTLGVVKLSWQANTEVDLKGYKILRADRPDQEFTMLNKHSITSTNYTDTVNVKVFNKKVYYKIIALDKRYNKSTYSDILALQRPDNIPPTSPIFDSYRQENKKVYLKWVKSSSDDVAKEVIYRKTIGGENTLWQKIYETKTDTTSFYIDKNIEKGKKYHYTLVAIDQSGLESPPSPPLAIDVIKTLLRPSIKGLYANVDREQKQIHLFWRYKEDNVEEFLIYKKKKDGVYTLFRTATANEKQLIDDELSPNTTYSYGIKAIFKNGSVSKWVETKVVY